MNNMKGKQRRDAIMDLLRMSEGPVSATVLAERFGVSRQIIVGDVALLRAAGEDVNATPRGYVLAKDTSMLRRVVACTHTMEQTGDELRIFVDNGCTVVDVTVEHPVYGQLVGALHLRSRYDVDEFLRRLGDSAPLSSLTGGLHLHNLLCPDEDAFERVKTQLRENGFLFE